MNIEKRTESKTFEINLIVIITLYSEALYTCCTKVQNLNVALR